MLGHQKINALIQGVLQRSQADEIEVVITSKEEQLTRFANSIIHQNVSETNATITVRLAFGRRVGTAATNDLTDTGLDGVVETAATVARIQPENPQFPGFPEPGPITNVNVFDEKTATCGPEARARKVGIICRRATEANLIASGAFSTSSNELAVANSHGVSAYHAGTEAACVVVVMSDDSAGYAADRSWRVAALDVPALGNEAVAKALQSRKPRDLKPGVYTVVLEPYATQDLVAMLGYTGMGALTLQEGRSWMDGRVGQKVAASAISIWDDGLDRSGLPLPFDFEGVPKQRVDVIRTGIATGVVYDTTTAQREEERSSTGHAIPPAMAADMGPLALNLFLAPGDATLDEMITSTDRGLLITRFHYTRPVHPRDAVITGLTRDGTFLIERGEIAYPVKNLRYTQSYLDALNVTEQVGQELKTLGSYVGTQRVPAVKLGEFRFTGVTQF